MAAPRLWALPPSSRTELNAIPCASGLRGSKVAHPLSHKAIGSTLKCTTPHFPRTLHLCTAASPNLAPAETAEEMSVAELKQALQDTLWGTERGLDASSDTRAEVNELISQLEASNPTPLPNEAIEKLNGTWKLIYTSNSELIALLTLGKLPLVSVGDITQTVDGSAGSVENRVQLSAPFSRTSLAATASFEVRSPKLLQVQFREGQVATPELLADFKLPDSAEVLGQRVDLAPLQAALRPLDGPVRSLIAQVGELLANAPDLRFPIPATALKPAAGSTWLLNTYLDGDLRITRGDGGSVFVLTKVQLPELPAAEEVISSGFFDE